MSAAPHEHDLLAQDDGSLESVKLLAREPSYRLLWKWLMGVLVGAAIVLFLPWRQNVQGFGEITALRPDERPQQAVAAVGGRIAEWFVQEGDSVSAGDPLVALTEVNATYLDPAALDRLGEQVRAKRLAVEEKRAKAKALERQATALDSAWKFARIRAENRITQLTAAVQSAALDDSLATVQARRAEGLFADGLRSRADLETAQQRALRANAGAVEQRAALESARADRAGVDAEYAERLAKVDGERRTTLAEVAEGVAEIAKLAMSESNLEERRELLVVRAPGDGVLVQALKMGIGEIVRDGEAIATIAPARPKLAVALQVDARDVPLMAVGDQVRLEFEGWPAVQFSGWPSVAVGTFGGRVVVIDQVAQPTGMYRVLVQSDPQEEAWPELLRIGSGARGWALLQRVPVWFEVWRLLNGFPPSLREAKSSPASGSAGSSNAPWPAI